MKKRTARKIKNSGGDFIDKANVNSFVRYSLETRFNAGGRTYFDGNIHLGDCTRSICWHTDYSDPGLEPFLAKLNNAIGILEAARKDVERHHLAAQVHKLQYKRKKGKKG